MFFVISGYLITGLILKDFDAGRFRIVDFFERRIRRIFPALALVTVATATAGYFILLPYEFKLLGQELFAQSVSASNFYFFRSSGYFDRAAELRPFLHTWSLAVEEQFYLVFSLAALVCAGRARLLRGIVLVAVVSFVTCLSLGRSYPMFNFFLLPSRAWELLLGAWLAAGVPDSSGRPRWMVEGLGWSGLLMIGVAIAALDARTPFPGTATLLPCVGAALVIWAGAGKGNTVGRLLSFRPVTLIGAISYSLYLWHWPAIVYSKVLTFGQVQPSQTAGLLIGVFLVSYVSWKYVETPLRRRGPVAVQKTVFISLATGTAVFGVFGLAINKLDGVPTRLPDQANRILAEGRDDYGLNQRYCYQLKLEDLLAGKLIELGGAGDRTPIEVLLWGDSHAAAVIPVMDSLCAEHGVRGVAAVHASTAPLIGEVKQGRFAFPESALANASLVEFVRKNRVRNVVLVAKWLGHLENNSTEKLHDRLSETVEKLDRAGAVVWILKQVPKPRWNVPTLLASAMLHGWDFSQMGGRLEDYRVEMERQEALFRNPDPRFRVARILDPSAVFTDPNTGRYRIIRNGSALYCDESHLSVAGAMGLHDLFELLFLPSGGSRSPDRSPSP